VGFRGERSLVEYVILNKVEANLVIETKSAIGIKTLLDTVSITL